MKATAIIAVMLAILLALLAFFFIQRESECRNEAAIVQHRVAELRFEVDKLRTEKAGLVQELQEELGSLSQEKEEEISTMKEAYEALLLEMKSEISEGQVTITQLADRLSISVVDRILFPSGEADITSDGLEVLKRVAEILGNVGGKMIQVEGHTDNVPISTRLQKKFPTNWELSTARATNVVRFLQQSSIDGSRLRAVGFSEYRPVATNETVNGRSQNRRIEIALLSD
ncbi:MAG: OmpA family protein [Ignavibacteria bacterium]|nr:OmpA family protein [Ignavibacteria bacterium]